MARGERRTARAHRRWWIALVVVVGLVGAGTWLVSEVRRGLNESYKAEARLHAMYFVLAGVREYIDDHRAWPRSWSELPTTLRVPVIAGRNEWGSGWPPLPELVVIDFTATLDQVAGQTPETFSAVKYTPGAHYNHAYPVQEVIDAAQRARMPVVK